MMYPAYFKLDDIDFGKNYNTRIKHATRQHGIFTVADWDALDRGEKRRIPNLGHRSVDLIEKTIAAPAILHARCPKLFADAVEIAANDRSMEVADYIRLAVREKLEREGYFKPTFAAGTGPSWTRPASSAWEPPSS